MKIGWFAEVLDKMCSQEERGSPCSRCGRHVAEGKTITRDSLAMPLVRQGRVRWGSWRFRAGSVATSLDAVNAAASK